MTRYVIRRLLWAVVLFVVVTFVAYVIFFLIPADPVKLFAGRQATAEDMARAAHYYGLDRPFYEQYWKFLSRLVMHGVIGDKALGFSFVNRLWISEGVRARAPVTASLVLGGAVFWMLLALPIGIVSALRPRSLMDRSATIFVLMGISLHPVFIGLIFLYVFGYKLHMFPIGSYADFFNPPIGRPGGPLQWAWHMFLPWCTFAILFAALYVRMIRSSVIETMNEDYVRTARAKGAPEWVVMRSHILRNALLPIVTMLGMDIALGMGGAVFTESVYSLPGLGQWAVQSLETFDLPVTMGVVVFATTIVLLVNVVIDVLYALIDPRIKLA